MKFCTLLFVASLLSIALVSTPSAADDASRQADQKVIEKLEHDFAKAMIKPDLEWFEKMLADDFKTVLPTGVVKDKKAFIESWRVNAWDYKEIDVFELDIRIYGDTAISIGRAHNKGVKSNGQDLNHDEFWTDVFLRSDGKWKLVSTQVDILEKK